MQTDTDMSFIPFNTNLFSLNLRSWKLAEAKQDYQLAKEHLLVALDNNPYPELNEFFALKLSVLNRVLEHEKLIAQPKSLMAKLVGVFQSHSNQSANRTE